MSAELAEKRLVHKADLICPHMVMPARFRGTVVLAILIGKTGDVLSSRIVSGPAMLRKPVIDAVRRYKYMPYLLNDRAVEVQTTIALVIDSQADCHFE